MEEELLESGWSINVSNDPRHRPQVLDRPSTTVRKEWCRRPQEAHLAEGTKYRRLSVEEIAIIQGFPKEWVRLKISKITPMFPVGILQRFDVQEVSK